MHFTRKKGFRDYQRKNQNEICQKTKQKKAVSGKGSNLYKHQVKALKIEIQGKRFVVTSDIGSAKSLTYLATIFNKLLQYNSIKIKRVKVIMVYPMNALINSQEVKTKKHELNYLISKTPSGTVIPADRLTLDEQIEHLKSITTSRFPITYSKYSAQENQETRERIKKEVPDSSLTNYMMRELIMTRQSEKWMLDC